MHIVGLGTAVPPKRYTQQECWEAIQQSPQYERLSSRSRAILRKVLTGDNGIDTRHLALDPISEAFVMHPDALIQRFSRWAPRLASEAVRNALQNARVDPAEVDAVIASTCTGYLCPGLTSYVIENCGLRESCRTQDLVGQGCGAALPNLHSAHSLLQSREADTVVSVCVEVCSAAFYIDDDPGVLISACLFGDGAGAAVLRRQGQGLQWRRSGSVTLPSERDALRFETVGGMLRNVLTRPVPGIASRAARGLFQQVCESEGMTTNEVGAWIFHPGGRDVLDAMGREFGLNGGSLDYSASVLRRHGNLSSASVFFVLQEALANGAPAGSWWMSSFGAGFSCHGALLTAHE